MKKGVLGNFAKFTGKHQCQSLFFNKVAALRPATLLKKRIWHRCFPVNLWNFQEHLFTEHIRVTASRHSHIVVIFFSQLKERVRYDFIKIRCSGCSLFVLLLVLPHASFRFHYKDSIVLLKHLIKSINHSLFSIFMKNVWYFFMIYKSCK